MANTLQKKTYCTRLENGIQYFKEIVNGKEYFFHYVDGKQRNVFKKSKDELGKMNFTFICFGSLEK